MTYCTFRGDWVVLHFYMTCCVFCAQNFHFASVSTPDTWCKLVWHFSVTCCIFRTESLEDQNFSFTAEAILCDTFPYDMLCFSFGKFSFGMIFVRRVGITTTVVRRPHGYLFLMRKNDFLSLYRGIWLNVSNIIFSDLTPVKCRLSYFVLARWVAFDHTLCLSALTTRLKVEDF